MTFLDIFVLTLLVLGVSFVVVMYLCLLFAYPGPGGRT